MAESAHQGERGGDPIDTEVPTIQWNFEYSGQAPAAFVLNIEEAIARTIRRVWKEALIEALEAEEVSGNASNRIVRPG